MYLIFPFSYVKYVLDFSLFLCKNRNNDVDVENWFFRKGTRILEAEKKAAEIEQEGRAKADDILAQAQKKAQSEYQEALSTARKRVAALYEKHKEDGSSESSASDSAAEKTAEKMRDDAEPNREAAISAAMNILMGR